MTDDKPKICAEDRISMTCMHCNVLMDEFARKLHETFLANPEMTSGQMVDIALEYAEDIERRNLEQFKLQNRSKRK